MNASDICEKVIQLSDDAEFGRALDVIQNIKWDKLRGGELYRLRLRSLGAEIFDYYGMYSKSADLLVQEGPRCVEAIENLGSERTMTSKTQWPLLKQQLWIAIHFGYTYYRTGEFVRAVRVFETCERAANVLVKVGSEMPGTLARVHYSLGLIYRETSKYSEAKKSFTISTEFAWRHLETFSERKKDVLRQNERGFGRSSAALADFNIARSLGLGLGFVHYIEGDLASATPLLLAAKTLLSHYQREKFIKAYVDVVYACVMRAKNGDSELELQKSIDTLLLSHETFSNKKDEHPQAHDYYRIRAAHQLALSYFQKARNLEALENGENRRETAFNDARRFLGEMMASDDQRFRNMAHIIESRILREENRMDDAAHEAEIALREGARDRFIRIDALIALGEIRVGQGKYEQGIRHLEEAIREAEDNPKVCAASHLHLVVAHIGGADLRRAFMHWASWKELEPSVENAFLRRLASRVESTLKPFQRDFIIHFSSSTLSLKTEIKKLRTFAVRWSRTRSKTDEEARAMLGVSRQTFHNWSSKSSEHEIDGPSGKGEIQKSE